MLVRFLLKNPDFLLNIPDFLLKNPDFLLNIPDFLLKNLDFIIQNRGVVGVVGVLRTLWGGVSCPVLQR